MEKLKLNITIIDDLLLEHHVQQYCIRLEIVPKGKAGSEKGLSHAKEVIKKSEAKWSLSRGNLEDPLKETSDEEPQMVGNGFHMKYRLKKIIWLKSIWMLTVSQQSVMYSSHLEFEKMTA